YIGTEHILLGLLAQQGGVASRAIESQGLSLVDARQRVEAIVGRGTSAPELHIPFTPRAKKILELALREAVELHNNFIWVEHILLGLLREGEGVACQVLDEAGIDLEALRTQTTQELQSGPRRVRHRAAEPWRPVVTTTGSPGITFGTPQGSCVLCM